VTPFRATEIAQKKEFDTINDFEYNRSVLFMTINSKSRYEQACYVGFKSYLMSYEYIRKSLKWAQETMLNEIQERGALFMTDSGAFSFLSKLDGSTSRKREFWEPYIEEYVQFLYDNASKIYCAANMDLDNVVGQAVVDEWNEKYFKPLEKYLQIVYVVHPSGYDQMAYMRLKDYASRHSYVGISSGLNMKTLYPKVAQIVKTYNVRCHGFGYTDYDHLMSRPMFSVDSSSWTMGSRYGETHIDDGKNFRPFNRNYHHLRKGMKSKIEKMGLDYEAVKGRRNKDWDVNVLNLHAWLRFALNFYKISNLKLRNGAVWDYWVRNESPVEYPDFYVPAKKRAKVTL